MPRVRRTVDRLGLASHVELPGYVDHAALPAVLAHSAIFVVPSRREALSIAAIEARSAGLPVVARVPSGVSEVVTHGRHGLLARSDAEIVDALATLCADRALRLRLAAHARRDLDRFAWSRSIARHEQIYALALERGAR